MLCAIFIFIRKFLYISLSDNVLKTFCTVLKILDFTVCKGNHNLAVCTLASHNCKKTKTYIIYTVFTVKHCGNCHCGINTAEKALADMTYRH